MKDNCLESIELPRKMKKINGMEIQLQQLTSFVIPTNVTKLNDYCFANCLKLTEIKGLEQIKEFGNGCLTRKVELEFDKLYLKKEELWRLIWDLDGKQQKQIEEWTGLNCSDIIFDSDVDNWSRNSSVLNERIIGKKQLLFLIEDGDREKFGYYLNSEIVNKYNERIETDDKSFEFNLESNGRIKQPMKFEIKNLKEGGYELYEKNRCIFNYIWRY